MIKLILERFGAGRYNHALARQQGRDEIAIGFTGARAGFGYQRVLVIDRIGNGLRITLLRGSRSASVMAPSAA